MGMYDNFKMDEKSENDGIILEYDESFRVTVKRAGGSNKAYDKSVERKTKKIKRALENDLVSNDRVLQILMEVYAETIVTNWETMQDGEWVQGIEGPDGERLEFNSENVLSTFKNLPDLFLSIKEDASKASLFREALREQDSKN